MSTTTRILIAFLLLLGIGMHFLFSKIEGRVKRQYLEAAEEPMVDTAEIFAAMLEDRVVADGTIDTSVLRTAFGKAHERTVKARIYDFVKVSVNMHVYVTDREGLVLFDSNGGKAEGQNLRMMRDVSLTLSGNYGARSTQAVPGDTTSSVIFVAAPIRHAGEIIGVVSVSKPQASMFSFMRETNSWIRSAGLLLFLSVSVGAVLVTGVFSRPIRRLTNYARAVARGERVKLPRTRPPELRTLAIAFEEMRDALEDRKYVETYVQTLTHEMKSPVAAIRGAAELLRESDMKPEARERFLSNIQAESRRLQNMVDRLLSLAAIESRKALEKPETIPLAALVEDVRAQLAAAAEARRIRLEATVPVDVAVRGEHFLVEIALTNLVQNAIDFSPENSAVNLTVENTDSDGFVEVVVEDEGAGIPEYALERVFDRFYSLQHPATGRKSSGLGLCFVREAAELHGGSVTIQNRTDRTGARATLRLPAAHLSAVARIV